SFQGSNADADTDVLVDADGPGVGPGPGGVEFEVLATLEGLAFTTSAAAEADLNDNVTVG
ncbi:MAG: hypothetical protein ACE5MM_11315, partial [Nitrospiraceae bacterium]